MENRRSKFENSVESEREKEIEKSAEKLTMRVVQKLAVEAAESVAILMIARNKSLEAIRCAYCYIYLSYCDRLFDKCYTPIYNRLRAGIDKA